jgi:flagellum-specific peptidoglycan hydrolase FlgJ
MAINITQKTSTTHTTASKGRSIKYIVIHYTAGVTSKAGSAASTAAYFASTTNEASADFIVDDSTIVQYNPDIANRYCWHCGGSKYSTKGGSLYGVAKNVNSIGIEVCSTNSTKKVTTANDKYWSYTDAVIAKAVELVKYLMEKYSIDADHVIRHYDVTGKLCPGIIGWNADSGDESKWKAFKAKLTTTVTTTSTSASGTQATVLSGLTDAKAIAKVGALFTANQKSSGVLASVSLAQFILESGYGKSELAQKANNLFGMKKSLSGNTWSGSTWDGTSVYSKETEEQKDDGTTYTVTAEFRKYASIEDSIADHSAYLIGAKNGTALRYKGLKGCTDYKQAAQIIKDGGYATSTTYVDNLCSIIEKWSLTKYDVVASTTTATASTSKTMTNADCPFSVQVSISTLNIRKGPGTNYNKTGTFTGKGVFTITAVQSGAGSKKGWGKLKSGAGWISLDYCTRT